MAKAKRDRLLVALIAKLPMEAAQWPRADRIAWLQMIAMALAHARKGLALDRNETIAQRNAGVLE